MIRNTLFLGAALTLLIIFVDKSHSIDFRSLTDQSSYRCSGGVVSVGDLDREVRKKCGDPLEIGRRQDFGPDLDILSRSGEFYVLPCIFEWKVAAHCGCPMQPR